MNHKDAFHTAKDSFVKKHGVRKWMHNKKTIKSLIPLWDIQLKIEEHLKSDEGPLITRHLKRIEKRYGIEQVELTKRRYKL